MLRASFIGFFAAAVTLIGSAQAADLTCTCSLPAQSVGQFTSVDGPVSLVRKGGSPVVKVGTPVQVGSRVVVGGAGSATIAFSRNCVVSLPANSDLIVTGERGGLCVAARPGALGVIAGAPAGAGLAGAGAGAAGGLAGLSGASMLAAGAVGVGAIGAAVAIGSNSGDSKGAYVAGPVSR